MMYCQMALLTFPQNTRSRVNYCVLGQICPAHAGVQEPVQPDKCITSLFLEGKWSTEFWENVYKMMHMTCGMVLLSVAAIKNVTYFCDHFFVYQFQLGSGT